MLSPGGLIVPGSRPGAASTPVFIKNGGASADNNASQTTWHVSVPAGGHAVGNTVIFLAAYLTPSQTAAGAVTDSRGNTWSLVSATTGTVHHLEVFASTLTTALQGGDAITITIAGGATFNSMAINTVEFSQVTTATDVAGVDAGFTSSTTPSAGPITPPDPVVLLFGAVGVEGPVTDTFTEDSDSNGGSSWTSLPVSGSNGGIKDETIHTAYKITSASAAQTYNPSLGTARTGAAGIVALKPAAGGASSTPSAPVSMAQAVAGALI